MQRKDMALCEMAFWHVLSTESFIVNRPYNSSTKILVSFPQARVSHGELEGLFSVACCIGGWNKLIIKFKFKSASFLVAWNGQFPQWRHLVTLNDRYFREAPESDLSPRWWRNGSQLSKRLDNRRCWRRCLPEQDAVSVSTNQGL